MFLVNLEQTSSCKFSTDHKLHSLHLWNFVSFAKFTCAHLFQLKGEDTLPEKNYQIFLSINIITLFSANLSWWNITAETKSGLASVFSITCAVCGTENVVKTSSEHRSSQRGPNSHDDNSRAALLYLHTGISETHLNNLLCTLNIPSMNPVTFKSRENEIGQAVKQVTKKSWQKQEKGHNSSTDQAAVMGLTFRKVMDYITRTKSCSLHKCSKKLEKKPKTQFSTQSYSIIKSNEVYSSSPFVYCSKT